MKALINRVFCFPAKAGTQDKITRQETGSQPTLGRRSPISVRGFTLVELLVSIAIFTIVTTVSVLNQSSFNGSIVLTNLAYEIGLSIRQAQVYGVTVVRGAFGSFDSGYGMRFDKNTPTRYYLFEDIDRNHFCDDLECGVGQTYTNVLETFFIQRGNRIKKICLTDNTNTVDCTYTTVDISFVRPNPDAYFYVGPTRYYKAEICIESPVSGAERKIIVEETGQICFK